MAARASAMSIVMEREGGGSILPDDSEQVGVRLTAASINDPVCSALARNPTGGKTTQVPSASIVDPIVVAFLRLERL